ncbi:hypothetical protein BRC60_10940 [Halobacteriales archaeon QH_1_68_42]|nr:MAG: hypothetical protein BRC60_10940 [Halobacteriales archaeon QH_1_68_42]
MNNRPGPRSDRGQSIALDYTLGLAVGFLLITGLLIAGGDYITDQRNRAQQSELRVIGQQLAADIEAADRLAAAATNGEVRIERSLVEVRVDLTNETAVAPTTFNGGFVVVEYTASGEIEVERGDRYA